ncbi:hypothetical protein [Candidatus Sororendozoicomonas aggregata]|uniref:hypothetical protein n=1 Tax=Candidatus Sororendozoicomonas aggregata TaxID=3073239 RepID=UPI002ED4B64A
MKFNRLSGQLNTDALDISLGINAMAGLFKGFHREKRRQPCLLIVKMAVFCSVLFCWN